MSSQYSRGALHVVGVFFICCRLAVRPFLRMIFESLQFYSTGQSYYFEPTATSGHEKTTVLVVNKSTGVLSLTHTRPASHSQPRVVYGILGMTFLLTGLNIIVVKRRKAIETLGRHVVYKVTETEVLSCPFTSLHTFTQTLVEDEFHYRALLSHYLNSAEMYFSYSMDLTRSIQSQFHQLEDAQCQFTWRECRTEYFCNQHVQKPLILYAESNPTARALDSFILPYIEGCMWAYLARMCLFFVLLVVGSFAGPVYSAKAKVILVSRRQWQRSGTRYHCRGIDHQGHVSNCVESEQILLVGSQIASHVQIRGSVPIYWRQQVNLKYQPQIDVSSTLETKASLEKHFAYLKQNYSQIFTLNLVNGRGDEDKLRGLFENVLKDLNSPGVKYLHFDFHRYCKANWDNLGLLTDAIAKDLADFGYFLSDAAGSSVVSRQSGVFRTNCIDCLDRTNVVQSIIANMVLESQLQAMQLFSMSDSFVKHGQLYCLFRNLWADNADTLSRAYSGTGALKTDYTRTGARTLAGALWDFKNSCERYIRGNFMDAEKQDAMDLFYGHFLVSHKLPTPFAKTKSQLYYLLMAMLLLCIVSLLVCCLVRFESRHLTLFITVVFLIYVIKMILDNGDEFVHRPCLVHGFYDMYGRTIDEKYDAHSKPGMHLI